MKKRDGIILAAIVFLALLLMLLVALLTDSSDSGSGGTSTPQPTATPHTPLPTPTPHTPLPTATPQPTPTPDFEHPFTALNLSPDNWVLPGHASYSYTAWSYGPNYMYWCPISLEKADSFTAVGAYASLAGTDCTLGCTLGLYDWDYTDHTPGNLLHDWGEIDPSSTGAKTIADDFSLEEGRYFTAIVCDCTGTQPQFRQPSATSHWSHPFSGQASTAGSYLYISPRNTDAASEVGNLSDPSIAPDSIGIYGCSIYFEVE